MNIHQAELIEVAQSRLYRTVFFEYFNVNICF